MHRTISTLTPIDPTTASGTPSRSPNAIMTSSTSLVFLLALLGPSTLGCVGPRQAPVPRAGRMDATHAFYYPDFAAHPELPLAVHSAGKIDAGTYTRYLAGRFGTRYLDDLAFDILLEWECRIRRLARNATLLARSMASRRFLESGRAAKSDPDGSLQRKFINESLRKSRVDALAGAVRQEDEGELRAFFERLFGIGGARVRVRHILVSFRATKRRLESAGQSVEAAEVRAAAKARATDFRRRLDGGESFAALLRSSDDRATKSMLRDPQRAPAAGELLNYRYQRYGEAFAHAVQRLKVGEVSSPMASSVGYHLIELLERRITKFADVEQRLREQLGRGSAKPIEIAALRRMLFSKYGFTATTKRN